jgi:hypothetical protein
MQKQYKILRFRFCFRFRFRFRCHPKCFQFRFRFHRFHLQQKVSASGSASASDSASESVSSSAFPFESGYAICKIIFEWTSLNTIKGSQCPWMLSIISISDFLLYLYVCMLNLSFNIFFSKNKNFLDKIQINIEQKFEKNNFYSENLPKFE